MYIDIAKKVREEFFLEFSIYHRAWLHELVEKYKERGMYPVFPTQIGDYYADPKDKDIAILSALCMDWDGRELEQIASMRGLMGASPWEWFTRREFVILSTGRVMNTVMDGSRDRRYWEIAKLFDILYDICRIGTEIRRPSEVFRRMTLGGLCDRCADIFHISHVEYKRDVIELVFRSSDAIGRGLWPISRHGIRCPRMGKVSTYLRTWFPDWKDAMWTFEEAVRLFGLENDYDFFYAYLAHKELGELHPLECSRYAGAYQAWFGKQLLKPKYRWQGVLPEIEF